jgi:hypothetical protein
MRGNVEPVPTVYQPPSGERALRIATLNDIEEEAAKVIPRGAFAYIAAGSANEWTLRENRRAFDRHALRSRALLLAKHSAADPLHSRGPWSPRFAGHQTNPQSIDMAERLEIELRRE